MLRLRVTPATGEPFERRLDPEGDGGQDRTVSLTVGRGRDADLALADRFLSRRHARIYRDPEASGHPWTIEDLGSQNGTYVNDVRIDGPTELRTGDVVRLSASFLDVVDDSTGPQPAARPAPFRASPRSQETVVLRSAHAILEARDAPPTDSKATAEALARYAERLRLINEIHQALGRSIGIRDLLDLILERVFDHLGPEEAAIYLGDSADELELAASRGSERVGAPDRRDDALFFSRSLAHEVTERGLAALVVDARTDSRFSAAESIVISGVRSIAAAPLLGADDIHGMLVLASRVQVRQFEEADLELLVSLASVAALHIRNRALADEAAERRRLAEEMALARRIQLGLLPSAPPEVPGWELRAGSVPSREVSGDYYRVTLRDDGVLVLMVVDVSGKGIAAALLTASIEALAAGYLEIGMPPEEVCDRVCRRLHRRTPPEKYATAFVAALDPATGTLRYANAGHNPGFVVRSGGGVETLGSTGPPLGLIASATRAGGDTVLEPGDLLVLYTDGLTEAAAEAEGDEAGEEYGETRLAALCSDLRRLPLDELAYGIEEDLVRFTGGAPFHDDRTLVLARRAGRNIVATGNVVPR